MSAAHDYYYISTTADPLIRNLFFTIVSTLRTGWSMVDFSFALARVERTPLLLRACVPSRCPAKLLMTTFMTSFFFCLHVFLILLLKTKQVFHVCDMSGRQDSFLCPNGTIFSQKLFACDWWYNVKCAATRQHYELNSNLFKVLIHHRSFSSAMFLFFKYFNNLYFKVFVILKLLKFFLKNISCN